MAAASRPVTAQFQSSWNRIKLVLELKMLYYYLLTEEELEAESNLYRVTELTHGLVHASRASCLDDGALLRHCHCHEYYCVAWKLIVTQTSLLEGFLFYTMVPSQQNASRQCPDMLNLASIHPYAEFKVSCRPPMTSRNLFGSQGRLSGLDTIQTKASSERVLEEKQMWPCPG